MTLLRLATVALFISALSSFATAKELVIGVSTDVSSLDPYLADLGPDNQIKQTIFEGLVHSGQHHELSPALATSWHLTDDPTVWEFKLREGVTFHDGSDFTADDVIYSYTRAPGTQENPTRYARTMNNIAGFEAIDDYTVQVKTKEPDPLLPANLTGIMIVSSEIGDAKTIDFNEGRATIGTGSYKLTEYVPGDRIVLKANEDHWRGAPEWDSVTYKPIPNNPSRVSALLAGDVDVINSVPTNEIGRLTENDAIEISQTPSSRVIFWVPDIAREDSPHVSGPDGEPIKNPMSNIDVRRAMTMAINREELVDTVMSGFAVPGNQVVSEMLGGYNPDIEIPFYDPERAKALLAEAGYPDGFRLTIHATNNRYINDARLAQAVGQMLSQIGIQVSVETLPVSGYFGKARNKEFSFPMVGWGPRTGEASLVMRPALASGSSNNYGGYENEEFNTLLNEALATMETDRRNELLGQAMAIAMEDVAIIPTHYQVNIWAARDGFKVVPRTDELTLPGYIKSTD